MNAAERAPYVDRADLLRFNADVKDYNMRIPLSPLVDVSATFDAMRDSSDDEDLEEDWDKDRLLRDLGRRRRTQIWNRYRRDHPQACGGPLIPVPDVPFPFLQLGRDLRDRIYAMVFGDPKELKQKEPDGTTGLIDGREEGPMDVRIFEVSKQVHEEAAQVFFQINTIAVVLGDNGETGLPPAMFRPDAHGGYSPHVAKVQKVLIMLPFHRAAEEPRIDWSLNQVCEGLKKSSTLREIQIAALSPFRSFKPEFDAAADRIMEHLSLLRGVEKVHFIEQKELAGRGLHLRCIIGTAERKRRLKATMTSRA